MFVIDDRLNFLCALLRNEPVAIIVGLKAADGTIESFDPSNALALSSSSALLAEPMVEAVAPPSLTSLNGDSVRRSHDAHPPRESPRVTRPFRRSRS